MNIIVVLGCHQRDLLNKRLDRALEEYKKLEDDYKADKGSKRTHYIMVSGCGRNREHEYMYEYVSKYVDKNYIIVEGQSMNTFENLIYSIKILEDKFQNKGTYWTKINLIICSSTFHIKRIIMLTKFLNKTNIDYRFIHTRENITEEQDRNELNNINNFLAQYASHYA